MPYVQTLLAVGIVALPLVMMLLRLYQWRQASRSDQAVSGEPTERDMLLAAYDATETLQKWGAKKGNQELLGWVLKIRNNLLVQGEPTSGRVDILHNQESPGVEGVTHAAN